MTRGVWLRDREHESMRMVIGWKIKGLKGAEAMYEYGNGRIGRLEKGNGQKNK